MYYPCMPVVLCMAIIAQPAHSSPVPVRLSKDPVQRNSLYAQDHVDVEPNTRRSRADDTINEERVHVNLQRVEEALRTASTEHWSRTSNDWGSSWAHWDEEVTKVKHELLEQGPLQLLHGKSATDFVASGALSTYVRASELAGRENDRFGVEALVESNLLSERQLIHFITSTLDGPGTADTVARATALRLQYGLLHKWWLKNAHPSAVENLLKEEDGLLSASNLNAWAFYLVQYFRERPPKPSLSWYPLDLNEATLFNGLSTVPPLVPFKPAPWPHDGSWSAKVDHLDGTRLDTVVHALLGQPSLDLARDATFIGTTVPTYVRFCESTAAARQGVDLYGVQALEASTVYPETQLLDIVIPALLASKDELLQAAGHRLVIGLLMKWWDQRIDPATVEMYIRSASEKAWDDKLSQVAWRQYLVQYKHVVNAALRTQGPTKLETVKLNIPRQTMLTSPSIDANRYLVDMIESELSQEREHRAPTYAHEVLTELMRKCLAEKKSPAEFESLLITNDAQKIDAFYIKALKSYQHFHDHDVSPPTLTSIKIETSRRRLRSISAGAIANDMHRS